MRPRRSSISTASPASTASRGRRPRARRRAGALLGPGGVAGSCAAAAAREIVRYIGDRQIRNRGTIGGALCHADPTGEMALCAVALGARTIVGPRDAARSPPRLLPRAVHDGARAGRDDREVGFPHGDGTAFAWSTRGVTGTSPWSAWPHGWASPTEAALDPHRARRRRRPGALRAPGLRGARRHALQPAEVEAAAARAWRTPSRPRTSARRPTTGRISSRSSSGARSSDEARPKSARMTLALRVNGRRLRASVESRRLLVDFLRHELGLTAPTSAASRASAAPARCCSTASR